MSLPHSVFVTIMNILGEWDVSYTKAVLGSVQNVSAVYVVEILF